MTSRPVKFVVCTLSLAVMLASSANAAKKMKRPAAPQQAIAGNDRA